MRFVVFGYCACIVSMRFQVNFTISPQTKWRHLWVMVLYSVDWLCYIVRETRLPMCLGNGIVQFLVH